MNCKQCGLTFVFVYGILLIWDPPPLTHNGQSYYNIAPQPTCVPRSRLPTPKSLDGRSFQRNNDQGELQMKINEHYEPCENAGICEQPSLTSDQGIVKPQGPHSADCTTTTSAHSCIAYNGLESQGCGRVAQCDLRDRGSKDTGFRGQVSALQLDGVPPTNPSTSRATCAATHFVCNMPRDGAYKGLDVACFGPNSGNVLQTRLCRAASCEPHGAVVCID